MDAQQVADEFWAEQRAIRERREEIARMPHQAERMEAHLKDAWATPTLGEALFNRRSFFYYDAGEALDGWLAEDGRVFEVYDALGLRKPWEDPPRWRRWFRGKEAANG